MDKEKLRKEFFVKSFECMRNLAELRALSKYSLETPLTEEQYQRMMKLKTLVFGGLI